ncbi:uncharacterized protein LOC118742143 [Rhagoletis pomonella]|uniref:uncharacterized protein LOC118742143 n=1 Tax=Rhagoletis pomonella TaxID=28610 RepID=UPI00177BAFCA|nr:uncharacterized protein LOC118742143 [Rhagoletis pomonella]
MPCLLNSAYGWIVGGSIGSVDISKAQQCNVVQEASSLEQLVKKFWEVEDCITKPAKFTDEEQMCEEHFVNTVRVQKDGRLQVRLPFKTMPNALGNSFDNASKRFKMLERRFGRDEQLKNLYSEFMNEYISLGHMSLAQNVNLMKPHFYIPHHCILRPQSLTTKLRVVFDASANTTSGQSLNELLMVGPTIQQDLIITLLSFRLNRFALTGDIAKMYRQFVVSEQDRLFQLILWRSAPTSPIETYTLNTVTYGMSAAPFLAIRALHHIADLHQDEFPIGANTLRNDLYVDDLLTGAEQIEELQYKKNELVKLLRKAGLQLTKFSSNCREITPTSENEVFIELSDHEVTKALGIAWQPNRDNFVFSYHVEINEPCTRRSILSVVARIFDILGLISPIIIRCKIFMQDLILKGLNWDTPIDEHSSTTWKALTEDLRALAKIEVPRYVFTSKNYICDIHGFADASERAYGCCLYVRAKLATGVKVSLLVAKSKVAPTRVLSLPKLELCAAVLLSRTWRKFSAPHFGGLWEAAVKSTKTIVLKNIANAHLTFEELQTFFIEVEAILNSRPIAPMTDDPNDAEAVTPAHFLIGSTLTPAPEETLYSNSDNSEKKMSYLNRWLKVAYLKQQFWSLWERDYVHSLQQRAK